MYSQCILNKCVYVFIYAYNQCTDSCCGIYAVEDFLLFQFQLIVVIYLVLFVYYSFEWEVGQCIFRSGHTTLTQHAKQSNNYTLTHRQQASCRIYIEEQVFRKSFRQITKNQDIFNKCIAKLAQSISVMPIYIFIYIYACANRCMYNFSKAKITKFYL